MTHRPYDEDFKKSIVALYQNGKRLFVNSYGKFLMLFFRNFCTTCFAFLIVEDIHDAPSEVFKVPKSVAHTF